MYIRSLCFLSSLTLLSLIPSSVNGYSACDPTDIFFIIDTASITVNTNGVIDLINSVIKSGSDEESGFSVIIYGDNVPDFDGNVTKHSILCEIDETAKIKNRDKQIEHMNSYIVTAFDDIIDSVNNGAGSFIDIETAMNLAKKEAKFDERQRKNSQKHGQNVGLNDDEDIFIVFDYNNALETDNSIYKLYEDYLDNKIQSIHFIMGKTLQVVKQYNENPAKQRTQKRIKISDPSEIAVKTHFFVFDELIADISDDKVHSVFDEFLSITCPAAVRVDNDKNEAVGLGNHVQHLEPETLVECHHVWNDDDKRNLNSEASYIVFYDDLDDESTATFNVGDYIIVDEDDLDQIPSECVDIRIFKLQELISKQNDADNNRNIVKFRVQEPKTIFEYITGGHYDGVTTSRDKHRRRLDETFTMPADAINVKLRPDGMPFDDEKTFGDSSTKKFGPAGKDWTVQSTNQLVLKYGADMFVEFRLGITLWVTVEFCDYCVSIWLFVGTYDVCISLPCGVSFGVKAEATAGYTVSAYARLDYMAQIIVSMPKLLYKDWLKFASIGPIPVSYKPWIRMDFEIKTEPIYAFAEIKCEIGHTVAIGYEWNSNGNGRGAYLDGPTAKGDISNPCTRDWGISNDPDGSTALKAIGVTATLDVMVGLDLYDMISGQFIAEFTAPLMVTLQPDGCSKWESCGTSYETKVAVLSFKVDMVLYYLIEFNDQSLDQIAFSVVKQVLGVAKDIVGRMIGVDFKDKFQIDLATTQVDKASAHHIYDTNLYTMDPICKNIASLLPDFVLEKYCLGSGECGVDWMYDNNCEEFLKFNAFPKCKDSGKCADYDDCETGFENLYRVETKVTPSSGGASFTQIACFVGKDQCKNIYLYNAWGYPAVLDPVDCTTGMLLKSFTCQVGDLRCTRDLGSDTRVFPSGSYFETDGQCYDVKGDITDTKTNYIHSAIADVVEDDSGDWFEDLVDTVKELIPILKIVDLIIETEMNVYWWHYLNPSIHVQNIADVDSIVTKTSCIAPGEVKKINGICLQKIQMYTEDEDLWTDAYEHYMNGRYFQAVDCTTHEKYIHAVIRGTDPSAPYGEFSNFHVGYPGYVAYHAAGTYIERDGLCFIVKVEHNHQIDIGDYPSCSYSGDCSLEAIQVLDRASGVINKIDCVTGWYQNVNSGGYCFKQIQSCAHGSSSNCLDDAIQFPQVFVQIHCISEREVITKSDTDGNCYRETALCDSLDSCDSSALDTDMWEHYDCDTREKLLEFDCYFDSALNRYDCCYLSGTEYICPQGLYYRSEEECYLNVAQCSYPDTVGQQVANDFCGHNNINCLVCMRTPPKNPNAQKIDCISGKRLVDFYYPDCAPDCLTDLGGCYEDNNGVDCHPIPMKIYNTAPNKCFKEVGRGGWGCLEPFYNMQSQCTPKPLQRVDCFDTNFRYDYVYPDCVYDSNGFCLTNYGDCPPGAYTGAVHDGNCHPIVDKVYYVGGYCVRMNTIGWGCLDGTNYLDHPACGDDVRTIVDCHQENECFMLNYYNQYYSKTYDWEIRTSWMYIAELSSECWSWQGQGFMAAMCVWNAIPDSSGGTWMAYYYKEDGMTDFVKYDSYWWYYYGVMSDAIAGNSGEEFWIVYYNYNTFKWIWTTPESRSCTGGANIAPMPQIPHNHVNHVNHVPSYIYYVMICFVITVIALTVVNWLTICRRKNHKVIDHYVDSDSDII